MSLAALIALAAPIAGLRIGIADDSNAPRSTTEHRAYDLLAAGKGFYGPLSVVVQRPAGTDRALLGRIGRSIARDAGVAALQPAMINAAGDTAVITVLPKTSPQDAATARSWSH